MKKEEQSLRKLMNDRANRKECMDAIRFLTKQLRAAGQDLKKQEGRMVISNISYRVKSPNSAIEKLKRKKHPISYESALEHLHDLIGVRAVCLFIDDIYAVRSRILSCPGVELVKEKDMIKKPKSTGYRSLHLILMVPAGEGKKRKTELQIRSMAMDFWSVLEYQLQYKKKMSKAKTLETEKEPKKCAADIAEIEEKMFELRNEIKQI